MTSEDAIYRALSELFKALEKDAGAAKILRNIAKAQKPERVTVTHNVCRVENDWLSAIERGLVFIGRAIGEDRQFIRSEGEVQPIEKVRRVSKESVQHLSRHSDLITRKQKKDDIVPDKLYTVERDSDYAVYENKFLYLLLLKIRDFTGVRYDAVLSAYKEYRGEFEVDKKVVTATRRLNIGINITDEQDDAVSAPADAECAVAIDRIDKILQSVAFYLRTPLMTEVAHAHKISSKITKTNVLLMNKNFSEALALYEYLNAYEGDGYTIERKVENLEPVSEKFKREFAAPAAIAAFLVYEHGLKLEDYFLRQYEKEEERRREEEKEQLARALKALKKRIEETGESAEQYMLMLEERNAALEKDAGRLIEARAKIDELNAVIGRMQTEINVLQTEIENLKTRIGELEEEMKRAEEEHQRQIEALKAEFEEKEKALKAAHAEEIAAIKAAAQEEYDALKKSAEEQLIKVKNAHAEDLKALKESHGARIASLREEHTKECERIKAACEARLVAGADKVKQSEATVQRTVAELKRVTGELEISDREKTLLGARLTATRREFGLTGEGDDFTTEAGFNALEHEFEVLGRLVREEWTDVKKILRKEFYGGIRSQMRKKKARKSEEYKTFSNSVKSRRAEAEAPRREDLPEPVKDEGDKKGE